MLIEGIAIYPKYYEDGKIDKSKYYPNGSDFALAVAKIPLDKYS